MKAKIVFFIVWFVIIGGINTFALLELSGRLKARGMETIEAYVIFSFFISFSFLIFCVIQWIRKELDIYQKIMTVLLAIVMATVGLAMLIDSM